MKKDELASGLVASDRSPIPPARASGEILKKGTAVVTTLMGWADCAKTEEVEVVINRIKAASRTTVDLIVLY